LKETVNGTFPTGEDLVNVVRKTSVPYDYDVRKDYDCRLFDVIKTEEEIKRTNHTSSGQKS